LENQKPILSADSTLADRVAISMETTHTVDVDYHELCGALAAKSMQALWRLKKHLLTDVPLPTTSAWMWKWDAILPLAKRAGEVVTLDRGGDRRVLALANPGLGGLPFTTPTLWGAIQYLGAGETAPAHRHSPGAIRFVMSGTGATTTVDGDVCTMEAGDLVLTPAWTWHDHNSESDEPVVWFDGLDLPLTNSLEAIFFENHPEWAQRVAGRDLSVRAFTAPGLRELGADYSAAHSPLLRYPWRDTDRALTALAELSDAPMVSLEYTDPVTGGPPLPALGCEIHRLVPDRRTSTVRKTGSSVYVAFRGSGTSVINGETFSWQAGDVFTTPSWSTVDHHAHEPSDLFAITDRPVLQALHLFKQETLSEPQEIRGSFSSQPDIPTSPAQ
jgi:gentisate 1,2-dioxygenase